MARKYRDYHSREDIIEAPIDRPERMITETIIARAERTIIEVSTVRVERIDACLLLLSSMFTQAKISCSGNGTVHT